MLKPSAKPAVMVKDKLNYSRVKRWSCQHGCVHTHWWRRRNAETLSRASCNGEGQIELFQGNQSDGSDNVRIGGGGGGAANPLENPAISDQQLSAIRTEKNDMDNRSTAFK
jgi:hypothetical protein